MLVSPTIPLTRGIFHFLSACKVAAHRHSLTGSLYRMKRLPTEEQMRNTIGEIAKGVVSLSVHDLDRVIAMVEGHIWLCQQSALDALNLQGDGRYHAGGIYYLNNLLADLQRVRDAKANETA